jgi:hypothetical protein
LVQIGIGIAGEIIDAQSPHAEPAVEDREKGLTQGAPLRGDPLESNAFGVWRFGNPMIWSGQYP